MCLEIVGVDVKCRVPYDEVEEHNVKLRRGAERLPVPAELTCKDAWECREPMDRETTIIYAGCR